MRSFLSFYPQRLLEPINAVKAGLAQEVGGAEGNPLNRKRNERKETNRFRPKRSWHVDTRLRCFRLELAHRCWFSHGHRCPLRTKGKRRPLGALPRMFSAFRGGSGPLVGTHAYSSGLEANQPPCVCALPCWCARVAVALWRRRTTTNSTNSQRGKRRRAHGDKILQQCTLVSQ
jgi:hypothetical protein